MACFSGCNANSDRHAHFPVFTLTACDSRCRNGSSRHIGPFMFLKPKTSGYICGVIKRGDSVDRGVDDMERLASGGGWGGSRF